MRLRKSGAFTSSLCSTCVMCNTTLSSHKRQRAFRTNIAILHEEIVATRLLLLVLLRVLLVDARTVVVGVATERDRQVLQEAVHTRHQHLGRLRRALHAGLTLVHHHAVRQVRRLRVTRPPHAHHDEIVLHHERRALRVQDVTLDHLIVTRPPRPQLSHTRYAARSRGRLTARRSGRCWRACPARG